MFPAADDYAYQIDGRITPHTSVEITKNSRETKFGGMDGGETTGRVNRGEGVSIDQALDMVGFGWGQIMVLIACGVANAADSVELASISFAIITSMECDLDLNDGRKGWIISATFIGMMVGGAFWGSLSDKYGRRKILLTALTVNLAGGLTCALVQTFWELILCRTICGLGVGGSIPILFSYYAEFLPSTSRGRSITVLAAFWMVGSIVVAVLAYLIISPKECDRDSALSQEEQCDLREINNCGVYTVYEREIGSWRIFLLSTSAPCLLAIVMLLFQPESPRWLALNGKTRKAEAVLKLLLRRNNKVLATGPIRLTTSPETGGGALLVRTQPARARRFCRPSRSTGRRRTASGAHWRCWAGPSTDGGWCCCAASGSSSPSGSTASRSGCRATTRPAASTTTAISTKCRFGSDWPISLATSFRT